MRWVCHFSAVTIHRKGCLMLHHLIQVANLANYNCYPLKYGKKNMSRLKHNINSFITEKGRASKYRRKSGTLDYVWIVASIS